MENKELKEVCIKNCTYYYYFDDITKLEDFDLDNILIEEKSHENIFIYDISYKTLIGSKPFQIRFDKIDVITEFMIDIDTLHCLALKNMMLLTTKLHILYV